MFAVPGWSVSADALKTQKEPKSVRTAHNAEPRDQNQDQDQDQNGGAGNVFTKKKRKRDHHKKNPEGPAVTDENLADLWKKYIEGKDTKAGVEEVGTQAEGGQNRKKRKKVGNDEAKSSNGIESSAVVQTPHQDGRKGEGREHEDPNGLVAGTNTSTEPTCDEVPPMISTVASQSPDTKLSGKAKYQHRKLLALKKKELKARLQATGPLPPSQPNLANQSTTGVSAEASPLPKPALSSALSQNLSPISPNPTSAATALTPLQSQMRSKLIAARFRHLNETLYTTASTHALNLFTESPSSFASYHAGFRAQVSVWPQNPVDTFIADLKARAPISATGILKSQKKKWREERKGKVKNAKAPPENSQDSTLTPLPRSQSGICTVADLGCGDAKLAASLLPFSTPHSLRLLSYDLATGDGPNAALITVADLCRLPLKDSEVDVAVLCLALMGTNWVDGVDEVRRVVRAGGEVWVAEIRSRFQRSSEIDRKHGNAKKKGVKNHKATTGDADNADEDDDEDGNITLDQETKPLSKAKTTTTTAESKELELEPRVIDPFLAIWRRRGFHPIGAIDQSNRMFVRMKFIKLATPTPPTIPTPGVMDGGGSGGSGSLHEMERKPTWTPKSKNKNKNNNSSQAGMNHNSNSNSHRGVYHNDRNRDRDTDPAKEREEEAKVLKPCVYKIR